MVTTVQLAVQVKHGFLLMSHAATTNVLIRGLQMQRWYSVVRTDMIEYSPVFLFFMFFCKIVSYLRTYNAVMFCSSGMLRKIPGACFWLSGDPVLLCTMPMFWPIFQGPNNPRKKKNIPPSNIRW